MLTNMERKKAEKLKIRQKVRIVSNFNSKSRRRKENKLKRKTNREERRDRRERLSISKRTTVAV